MPEIKVIEVIEPPVSVKLTNGVKGDQGKSIVSASFVDNDIVFVNDENEEIVIEGGKISLQGSSAYQVWLDEGNEGTVEDYLASLKGEVTTSQMNAALGNKVDKVEGKGLSTNDYSNLEKFKSREKDYQIKDISRTQGNGNQCVVTFIADDSPIEDYTILKPIFEAEGVPFSIAYISNRTDGKTGLTPSQMNELYDMGCDFGNHTAHHINLTTVSESVIESEIVECKNALNDLGFPCKFIVYPNNSENALVRKVAKKYEDFGFTGTDTINQSIVPTYAIRRMTLGGYLTPGKDTLEFYKAQVDSALANKRWLVFMLHSNAVDFSVTQQSYLLQTIQYIKSLNIPILNATNAYGLLGNALAIGDDADSNANYLVLSNTGAFKSTYLENTFAKKIIEKKSFNTYTNSSLITDFPIGEITYCDINNAGATGFPENTAGILSTNRLVTTDDLYAYQEYHIRNTNRVYRRYNTTGNIWTAWELFPTVFKKIRFNTLSWNQIAAGGGTEKDVTITDSDISFGTTDTVIFNTIGYFEAGIIPIISVKTTNVIKIRLQNVSGSPITPANRQIMATIIKNAVIRDATVTGN